MQEYFCKRRHLPTFGSWDCNEDLPFTQCFGSVRQTSFSCYNSSDSEDRDLYGTGDLYANDVVTSAMIIVPRVRANVREQQEKEAKRQNCVTDGIEALGPTAKPVDEDLYEVSPQRFIKIKKKRGMGFLSNCLMPTCNA